MDLSLNAPSPFEAPSIPNRILSSPFKFLAQILYLIYLHLRGSATPSEPPDRRIRIACISDTHCLQPENLPDADILIHAGDLSNDGSVSEIQAQLDWLLSLKKYQHIIVIAGNHDSYFDPRSRRLDDKGRTLNFSDGQQKLHYLQHSSVTLSCKGRQLKVYAAPQIPACGGNEFAFQYEREQDAWRDTIPLDTDVLVTHTPPKGHCDLPRGMGCEWLLREVWRCKPRAHIFGHVHLGHGREEVSWDTAQAVYERVCSREEKGVLYDALALWTWVDIARLLFYGVLSIIWSRVWGGNDQKTVMVNAALMLGSTGKLGNPPQLIEV